MPTTRLEAATPLMPGTYPSSESDIQAMLPRARRRSEPHPERPDLPALRKRRSSELAPASDFRAALPRAAGMSLPSIVTGSPLSSAGWNAEMEVPYDDLSDIDYGDMLTASIDQLLASAKQPVPANIRQYLFNTYTPHAISVVVSLLLGPRQGGVGLDATQKSLFTEAAEEITKAATAYVMGLPRVVTAAEWKNLYDTTLQTPAFRRKEASLPPDMREKLGILRDAMERALMGDQGKKPVGMVYPGDRPPNALDSMRGLFHRYLLFFNQPTERKTVDFNEVIEAPPAHQPELLKAAKRLGLIGLTRFQAMLKLCHVDYPQVGLEEVFAPYLSKNQIPADALQRLRDAGLAELKGHEFRSPLFLMRGDGGSGKSTIARAVNVVLGLEFGEIDGKDATLDSLLGPDHDCLLNDLESEDLRDVFGHLPVLAMRARYLDFVVNMDNIGVGAIFEAPSLNGAPPPPPPPRPRRGNVPPPPARYGAYAGAGFQQLLDVDTESIKFASLGMASLKTIGWLMFGSTNQDWPPLPPGSRYARDLAALLTRIREVKVHLNDDEKTARLETFGKELGMKEDNPITDLIPFVVEADQHHGGVRDANKAIKYALAQMVFAVVADQPFVVDDGLKEGIRTALGPGPLPAGPASVPPSHFAPPPGIPFGAVMPPPPPGTPSGVFIPPPPGVPSGTGIPPPNDRAASSSAPIRTRPGPIADVGGAPSQTSLPVPPSGIAIETHGGPLAAARRPMPPTPVDGSRANPAPLATLDALSPAPASELGARIPKWNAMQTFMQLGDRQTEQSDVD